MQQRSQTAGRGEVPPPSAPSPRPAPPRDGLVVFGGVAAVLAVLLLIALIGAASGVEPTTVIVTSGRP